MDLNGVEVDRETILKKLPMNATHALERCEVIVSDEKRLELKFHRQNVVLSVKFHCGHWNTSGVPQH